jgi:arylsulfatase A-like enzyme
VPAVIRWPKGVAAPGRRVDDFVSLADFGPTFLELAGLDVPEGLYGRSLLPFLRGERQASWRDALITQCNGVELYYTQRSILTRRYRYTFNGFDFDELYDLEADPGETVNLAEDVSRAELKRELCAKMMRLGSEAGDACPSAYITVGLHPGGPAEAFAE